MFKASDVEFMAETLEQIGLWVERDVTVFEFGSVDYSGTTVEAGDPPTVTFGTRADTARIERVNAQQLGASGGRYQADDRRVAIRGTFSSDDSIVFDSGTYRPVDGPWKHFIGSDLFYQAVCREVQS